jgi:hypothetical protein
VAIVVCCALLARRFREKESAPICDAADDAAGGEDLVACCASDSGGLSGVCEGGLVCVEGVLFDLVDATAGTDLGNGLVEQDILNSALRLTTPINSYNMADVNCWCLRAGYVTALP